MVHGNEYHFYDLASYNSFWRGYWYYKNGNVLSWNRIGEYEYEGTIKSDNQKDQYNVTINIDKPRSSKCNCPFADGTRKICKHMVALYFAVFPEEFIEFEKELEEERKEQEERIEQKEKALEEKRKEIEKDISKWSKEELINYVVNTMLEAYEDNEFDEYYDDERFGW